MIVWRHLTACAVLFVSLIVSAGAEAGSRQGGHGYGGRMHAGPVHVARVAHVGHVAHVPMHVARPYTAASYAPRLHHAHHAQVRVIRYAAPVQQVRYVHYQPTVHHQATYSSVHHHTGRGCVPRPHCVC